METKTLILAALSTLALVGCAGPTVNLATSEPIKVDIAMRLDVYQHTKQPGKAVPAAPTNTTLDPEVARRNRMAEIQEFKNQRLVGEGRDGLLAVRVESPGDFGDYVRKTVAAENADRSALMKSLSEREKSALPDVQARQAELWRKRSFKDEWIESPSPDGTWQWVQKE